jgi:hypothetical protein
MPIERNSSHLIVHTREVLACELDRGAATDDVFAWAGGDRCSTRVQSGTLCLLIQWLRVRGKNHVGARQDALEAQIGRRTVICDNRC